MTKPIFLTAVLLGAILRPAAGHAQNLRWVYQYDGPGHGTDEAWPMVLGSDGNLYAAGWSTGSGTGFDITVVSVSLDGSERWVYRYNGPGSRDDEAHGVVFGSDGNVYAAGSSVGVGTSSDFTIVSLDTAGHERWVYRYNGPANGGDEARSIDFGRDGNVYAAGWSGGAGTSDDFTVVSLDTSGHERWVYRYNGPGNGSDRAYARRMASGADGNVYAAGYSTGDGTGADYTVVSLDSLGSERWVYRYDGPASSEDMAWCVEFGPDGNVHSGGYSSGEGYDFTCISLAPDGRERWVYRRGADGRDEVWGIASAADGSVYPGGELSDGPNHNFAVVGLDSSGNERWVYSYNGPYNDYVGPVHVGWDGNVYAAGKSYRTSSDFDFVIASIDRASGSENWFYRYDGQAHGWDNGEAVLLAPNGDLYAAGSSTKSSSGQDFTILSLALPHAHDVGPTRIMAPAGAVDSGTSVSPRVVVHNFGTFSETFPVTIAIGDGYAHTVVDTLTAGATDTVTFPAWSAAPVGMLGVTCYTGLAGDERPSNDTLRDSVLVTRPPFVDVGVTRILAPVGFVDSGAVVVPRAVVCNLGTDVAIFWTVMRIGAFYSLMVADTLGSGQDDTVAFASWVATPLGPLPVVCYTLLSGDQNPANDTLVDSVTVLGPRTLDVGAVRILAPVGMVDSASTHVPAVVVRNHGTRQAAFPVTMSIGASYLNTVQETLDARTSDTLVFPVWTASALGRFDVACWTALEGDEYPANDTARDTVRVAAPAVHDVGTIAIISPGSHVRTGDTVIPRARVKNFGTATERSFDAKFRIGTTYGRNATVVASLAPDSSVVLAFDPWVAASGNYVVSCSTMLSSDANRANDKLTASLSVSRPTMLVIDPDQTDHIKVDESKTYRFYVELDGDEGDVVELAKPLAPAAWSCQLYDSADMSELTDTDADGRPDVGLVFPGYRRYFALRVHAPTALVGDTAMLAHGRIVVRGFLAQDTLVRDSAVLTLKLVPDLSIHNFPNPFQSSTTFLIGLPDDGDVSLTIYNRAGECINRLLEHEGMTAGVSQVEWDATNLNGRPVAPGTYQYVLEYVHQGKSTLVKKKLVVNPE